MTAAIYLDPTTIQPVLDGKRHRTGRSGLPQSGQAIVMLCGASGVTEYRSSEERRSEPIHYQCEPCDEIFRQQQGIPLRQDRIGR